TDSAVPPDSDSKACFQWTIGSAAPTPNGPTASTVSTPISTPISLTRTTRQTRRATMPETRASVDLRTATPAGQLVIERMFHASPEQVSAPFPDPEQLKRGGGPNGFPCPAADVDLRVGGTYRLAMEWPHSIPTDNQFSHCFAGEYYEIDRPNRLV